MIPPAHQIDSDDMRYSRSRQKSVLKGFRQPTHSHGESNGAGAWEVIVLNMRSERKAPANAERYRVCSALPHLGPDMVIFGLLGERRVTIGVANHVCVSADPTRAMADFGWELEWF